MKKVLQPEGLSDVCLLHMCKVSMDRCLKFGLSLLLHPCFIYPSRDMCGSRGGGGGGGQDPPRKSQSYGLLSNTGLDPLENHKATKPAVNVGPSSA